METTYKSFRTHQRVFKHVVSTISKNLYRQAV